MNTMKAPYTVPFTETVFLAPDHICQSSPLNGGLEDTFDIDLQFDIPML